MTGAGGARRDCGKSQFQEIGDMAQAADQAQHPGDVVPRRIVDQAGRCEFIDAATRFQQAAAVGEHVAYPVAGCAVGQGDDKAVWAAEHVDRRAVEAAAGAASMDHHAESWQVRRQGAEDPVGDASVQAGDGARQWHAWHLDFAEKSTLVELWHLSAQKVHRRRILRMARTGRRRGLSTSRAAILEAARARFAQAGYDATSLRAIAGDAGVDTGVVLHFFGSKDGLFRAVVGWPFDPTGVEAQILDDLGKGLARIFFSYCEDPSTGPALAALLRSAMSHAQSATLLREFVGRRLFAAIATQMSSPNASLRVELASAQLIGIAVLRYILRVEPIASATVDELVDWVEPVLERYLEMGGI